MRRPARALSRVMVAAIAALGAVVPAVPAVAAASPSPALPAGLDWEAYRTQPFTVPAGARCAFPVAGEPVLDEERIATLTTFPDGSPEQQVITGDLRMRYTNLDTGASVEHLLDGTALITYGTDGSMVQRYVGAAMVGFRSTDPWPVGLWRLDGYHEVRFGPDGGEREILVDGGTEHNICTDID